MAKTSSITSRASKPSPSPRSSATNGSPSPCRRSLPEESTHRNAMHDFDVIDRAAGLAPGDPLHTARRFRAKIVDATEASHDALLMQPVPGLSPADRLRVAVHAC